MPKTTPSTAPGFFASIPGSIYSPSFYAGIAKRSFGKAFGYLCGFTIITMLLWVLVFILPPVIQHWGDGKAAVTEFLNIYPDDLVITIKDGEASTNVEEPYYFRLSEVLPVEEWDAEGQINGEEVNFEEMNLVVIDTKTPYSYEQFKDYKTVVWLTKNDIYVLNENEKVETFSLSEVPDTVLDKEMADELAGDIVDNITALLPALAIVAFIFVFIFLVVGHMFYLLSFAFLLWVAMRIMNLHYDYGDAYKMGMYAATLPTLITILVASTAQWTGFSGFTFMFTLVGLLVAIFNIDKARRQNLISV